MMSSISRNNKQDVMELTWQNGQLALQELELNPSKSSAAAAWGGEAAGDHTLESIVHQATAATTFNTHQHQHQHQHQQHYEMAVRNWDNNDHQQAGNPSSGHMQAAEQSGRAAASGKRVRSELSKGFRVEESACASASATFCRETDTTMMTWNSFESPRSLKNARTTNADDDSISLYQDCSENQDGERGTKGESCRSQSSARRSRAAAIHNLSERRRRDRINEKMKALQKLVPNASKTDKASMLDEVIEYLKQLQAQIHMMMSSARNMPQMVMPLGMQQQLQMSILARMGIGMGMGMGMGMSGIGMGMLDVNNLTRNVPPSFPPLMHAPAPLGTNTSSFVSPLPFTMPTVAPPPSSTSLKVNVDAAGVSTSMPNFDAYNTFLAQQSMNMEFLNKMSALYRQQNSQQPSKKSVNSLPLPNHDQGG